VIWIAVSALAHSPFVWTLIGTAVLGLVLDHILDRP
jgi:hypothetical protein